MNIKTVLHRALLLFVVLMMAAAPSCRGNDVPSGEDPATPDPWNGGYQGLQFNDPEDASREASGKFDVVSVATGKTLSPSGSVYTIREAGEYTLTGRLEGSVVVNAGKDDKVTLILDGASISARNDAPITVLSADNVTIRAEHGSYNIIRDHRSAPAEDRDAAIWSAADLKIKGGGVLIVRSDKGLGIKTKDDLKLSEAVLKVVAKKTALRGNDSVTVSSGELFLFSQTSHGVKSSGSDLSSKGKQRGDVQLSGGKLTVWTYDTGVDAAHDVIFDGADVTVLTASYGGFGHPLETAAGVRAANAINICAGSISVSSDADGLHADAGEQLGSGLLSVGSISITGGDVTVESRDDAVHADGDFTITGGKLTVPDSHEAIEANTITVAGGTTTVSGSDDGLNAQKGAKAPLIRITAGVLDVTVPEGKSDAIDSNGDLEITGGLLIVRCAASAGKAAGSIEVKGEIRADGGTVLAFGRICDTPKEGSSLVAIAEGKTFCAGSYALLSPDEVIAEFKLDRDYVSLWIASDRFRIGGSYVLEIGGVAVLDWMQTGERVSF